MDLESLEIHLNSTDHEKKIDSLGLLEQSLREGIETPDPSHLTSLLQTGLQSTNTHVTFATLQCLPHYFPLLASSPQQLHHACTLLLPFAFERLGDGKERTREVARGSLVRAGRVVLSLKEGGGGGKEEASLTWLMKGVGEAFGSKNAKVREQILSFALALRSPPTTPLAPLKPFTPLLLTLLSDADPTVRALALSVTINIFSESSVTSAAKADLKKEMIKREVGKKVQEVILGAVLGGTGSEGDGHAVGAASQDIEASSPTSSSSRPIPLMRASTSAIPLLAQDVPAIYIADLKDLVAEIESMIPDFEGKETEFNWGARDRSIGRLRGLLRGNVVSAFEKEFLGELKRVVEGILKTASSLRTTIAVSALSLISELSTVLGPSFDPFLAEFLSHTLIMAGQNKKLVATASQNAVTSLITNSHYHLKTIQLIWTGMNDKIVLARTFVSAHLITFVKVHGEASRNSIENGGGLEVLEQCIKKGLVDSNATVKENSRTVYWLSKETFPKMTERVLGGLDSAGVKALEKADPSKKSAGVAGGKVAGGKVARPSVRSMIAMAKAAPRLSEERQDELQEAEGPGPAGEEERPAMDRSISSPPLLSQSTFVVQSSPSPPSPIIESPAPIPTSPTTSTANKRRSLIPRSPTNSHIISTPTKKTASVTSSTIKSTQSHGNALEESQPHLRSASHEDTHTQPFASTSRIPIPSSPTPTSSPRPRTPSLILPITEPIVDQALRDQAHQAESTAERLLEITKEEQEEEEAVEEGDKERNTTPLPIFAAQRTPLAKKRVGLLGKGKEEDVFDDSPEVSGRFNGGFGAGVKSWWDRKVAGISSTLKAPIPPDSAERKLQISTLISSLQSKQIDASGLRKLTIVSKERPVLEDEEEEEDNRDVLASPSIKNRVVVGDGGVSVASVFWEEGRKFDKILEGLKGLLLAKETSRDKKDAALVLLKNLVQYQFPCISGDESGFYALLLRLREDTSRSTVAAVESISTLFCDSLEPLYGLGILRSSLSTYLGSTATSNTDKIQSPSYGLGMRMMGKFFEKLPGEILEEEVPKAKGLIMKALNDTVSGELRRTAMEAIVSAQTVLRNETKLFESIGGLSKDQLNLLSYYFSRIPSS